jgi:hypothetical protein
MNTLFKHLPFPTPKPLTQEALAWVMDETSNDVPGKMMVQDPSWINPDFKEWIENQIGLFIADIEIFYSPPNYFMPIHTDGEAIHSEAKLNYMYGAPKSQMKWWMPREGIRPTKHRMAHANQAAAVGELVWTKEDCIELDSTEVMETLVNVGIPHNIVNGKLPRKCVSVIFDKLRTDGGFDQINGRFQPFVTFEDALELFSNEDAYKF